MFHRSLHKIYSISIHHFSTSSSPTQPHFMVNYLTTTLNLSKADAIFVTSKIHHLKSPKNPQSVINFLTTYNLSTPQIISLILTHPHILLRNVDKTLKPKFNVLSELGFSVQDLVTVITRDPNLLLRSLDTAIVPTINLLMKVLGSKEKIVKAVLRSHWPFYGKSFRTNVELLKRYGVCNKDIERLILRNPRLVTQSPVRLEEKLVEVEQEFGISPGSSMFSYGLSAFCSMNKLNLRRKFEVFKGFGWCEADVLAVVKSQPLCLTHSEERLRRGLSFFMGELGYTSEWLSSRGSLLMYSLEKRVKPRYRVYVVLKEKGLMARELHTLMCYSEADFVKNVVQRHREELPDHLYDSLIKRSSIGS
ncbi:putative transcription regulator mTERF family [Helianthus annuus]|nr:putative transcription regulator mTERF family [Helianthus annuus]